MAAEDIQGARDFVGSTEVMRIFNITRPTLNSYLKAGKFPKPLRLPGRRARWLRKDIEAALRAAGAV